jgi:TM2 domain-containing membrane protein YozV
MRYTARMNNDVPPVVIEFMGKVVDNIINPILSVIFALALVLFLFGLLRFVLSKGDENALAAGKQHMLWGTVGMTIMISVYAILWLMLLTFGVDGTLPDPIQSF